MKITADVKKKTVLACILSVITVECDKWPKTRAAARYCILKQ